MMTKRKIAVHAALFLGWLLASGCLGYRLGNALPQGVRSIHVPTFVNQTTEPLIENAATDETIARFQFDGALNITDKARADAVLHVTLLSYATTPVSFDSEKSDTANEYRAALTAKIMLLRTSDDSVIMENPGVVGEATFLVQGDLASARLESQDDVAQDLARRIVDAVTQSW